MVKKKSVKKKSIKKSPKTNKSSKISKSSKTENGFKKILVVDDEKDIRDTVKKILKTEGYKIKTAINADDALKKLKSFDPDLILLDIMMPGTPVRRVLPKIKHKIAFLSVVRTSEAEKELLLGSRNIIDFFQKPFDIKDLIKRVKKAVK